MPFQHWTGFIMKNVLVLLLLFLVVPSAVQSRLTTFQIIQMKLNQTEAQTACKTNYTDLVTLYSEEHNTVLDNLMKSAAIHMGWIGLHRGQPRDKWSNGDGVTFRSETGDCGTGVCCTAMKPDGSWERLNCTDHKPFMCYEEGDSCSPVIYHVILENVSWYDAQRYCRQNYTDLVSIRDQQQNEEVKIKGGNSTASFWIGLLHDDWEWSDGGSSSYRNWGTGHPRQVTNDWVCLANGKWFSAPNTYPAQALCSHSNASVFSTAFQSRLTTFHIIPKKVNQIEAQTACRTKYTDLVTLYSEEDNTVLDNLMKSAGINSGWTGLHRGQPSDKWSNGDAVTFSIETGDCGTGVCCTAMKPDGSWERLNCTDTRDFMCYQEDEASHAPVYHVIYMNVSWYDAQRYCRQNYTDLVSIRDQQQNEELKIKGGNRTASFWIGLLNDDWEWSDGGSSAYRKWSCGQIRPSDGVKIKSGRWISAPINNADFPLCYRTSIHVSDERVSWERALNYCQQENRSGILRIEDDVDQKEVARELRRRRVQWPLWVGLGQSRISQLLKSSNRLALGPWAGTEGGSQPRHHSTKSVEQASKQLMDITELRAVCELKYK